MMESNVKLSGEPSAQALASGLATLGRYGDNYMVHAAEGETFVPKEILDANPALKTQLFDQMKAMGIENPNRYVVGDALNSINPVTGQPEFFFKKIFKAVKNVFKKVLPIAAPIIGNIIAPGIGGLVASGLTAKLQGGSWGDALKAAGLSYAGGALTQGIMGGLNAAPGQFGTGFTEGLSAGAMAPFQAAQGLVGVGDYANPLKQGIFSGNYFEGKDLGTFKGVKDTLLPTYDKTGGTFTEEFITPTVKGGGKAVLNTSQNINPEKVSAIDSFQLNTSDPSTSNQNLLKQFNVQGEDFGRPLSFTDPLPQSNSVPGYPNVEVGDVSQANINRANKIYNEALDKSFSGGKFVAEKVPLRSDALQQVLVGSTAKPELSFLDKAKEALTSPKVLGPVLSAGIPAALTYAMSDDEELTEDQLSALTDPQRAAYDQFKAGRAANPNFAQTPEGQALLSRAGITSSRTAAQLARSTGVPLSQAEAFQKRRYGIVSAAGGGEIIGPGSGTSDSIPAMLSDGEFVMTAEAVRNAGNGDRDLGAARMYDMMNKFERAV
jgi:hypothetical protein